MLVLGVPKRKKSKSSTVLIAAEIHRAIRKLGRSDRPATPDEARRALHDLDADTDLRRIVDFWQEHVARLGDLADAEKLARRGCAIPNRLRC